MKKRRENEGTMMEEAIEKASQLIGLLQKENVELKRRTDVLEKDLEKAVNANEELKSFNKELQEEILAFQGACEELKNRLQKDQQALAKSEEALRRKATANKELHQKISILNAKLKEKNKSTGDEKTKILSIQNQNQYLLKKLKHYEQKENFGTQKINQKQIDYQNQIKQVVRLKEAFARRCEELKADNMLLTEKAAEYKQRLFEAENRIVHTRTEEVARRPDELVREVKVDGISYYQQLVDRLLRDKLGVTPEASFEGKIDQLSSFVGYRLAHIEKMCQGIMDKLQVKEWHKLQNLKDLNTFSFRMHSYLSDLLSKAS